MTISRTITCLTFCLTAGSPLAAQTAASVTRFDGTGFVGAYSAHKPDLDEYTSWYSSLFGAGSLGFYWTDHWKTEVDVGAAGEDELYEYRRLQTGTVQDFIYVRHTFQATSISIAQHYQFFRNAWFHPSVGAGVMLTLERNVQETPPVFLYSSDRPPAPPILVHPAQRSGPDTHTRYDPFVTTGFKAYMSRRSFFRSDVKVAFGESVKDVTLRFGFGLDF